MAKVYKRRNAREYTVALSAQYSASVKSESMWEAEDAAYDPIEATLKQNDVEDIDIHIIDEHKSHFVADEYKLKLKVNMVIPVESTDYTDAWNCAVEFVENITMPEGITLDSTAQIDMTLAEEKAYLRRCV